MIRVILPIIAPAVVSVTALNFNHGIAEYDMTAFLYHPLLRPLGPVIKAATNEDTSLNAMAMTFVYAVILMVFSSVVLYVVYGKKSLLKRDRNSRY
jgi:iron(III) transport system permease protein